MGSKVQLSFSQLTSVILPLAIIQAAASLLVPSDGKPQNHGIVCNESNPCDFTKGLACLSGHCSCLSPDTMWFNVEESTCQVHAGKSCYVENPVSLTLTEGAGSTRLEGPREQQLPCVTNSSCSPNSRLCFCNSPYELPSSNGLCIPKGILDEHCEFLDCRDDLGLICSDNKCICDPDKSLQVNNNHTSRQCVGTVGNPCVDGACAHNSICTDSSEEDGASQFQYNSTTDSQPILLPAPPKVCKCSPGTFPTRSGTCEENYGILCNSTNPCITRLSCGKEGVCECPRLQVFSEEYETCVALAGTHCNANYSGLNGISEDVFCGANAECIQNGSLIVSGDNNLYSSQYCQCIPGFEKDVDGFCVECDKALSLTWISVGAVIIVIILILILATVVRNLLKKQKIIVKAMGG